MQEIKRRQSEILKRKSIRIHITRKTKIIVGLQKLNIKPHMKTMIAKEHQPQNEDDGRYNQFFKNHQQSKNANQQKRDYPYWCHH